MTTMNVIQSYLAKSELDFVSGKTEMAWSVHDMSLMSVIREPPHVSCAHSVGGNTTSIGK
jgi:hypothetical protein